MSGSPARLGEQDLTNLVRTRGWARFLAVLYLVISALMLLGVLGAAAVSARFGGQILGKMTVVLVGAMVMCVIGAGLYGVLNWRYSAALYAMDRDRGAALVTAFRNVRLLWMITAVCYGLAIVYGLLTILGTLTGVQLFQPPVPPPG